MDRPSRKTKMVNYRESNDMDDDDDDFADVKAAPSKKFRMDEKQKDKKSSSKSSSQESNSLSQNSRRPLDQKLLDRDLEAAITLSLLNSVSENRVQSTATKEVKVQLPVDENTDPLTVHLSNCSVDAAQLGLDEITSEYRSPAPSKQRKAAAAAEKKKQIPEEEDEDYQPKLTPDSESDENFSEAEESEDDEFTVKKVSKVQKKEKITTEKKIKSPAAAKKEKQTPKPSKSKPTAAAAATSITPVRKPAGTKSAPLMPALSPNPAGGRTPKWNPPGHVGKCPSSSLSPPLRSPSQGLRLGLSRRVRVKPLHPSVATH
ncbi:RAD51-associated protein 1 [Cynoglossus semilaevis]|uniref:RAD51 associated protein 1 n=1 Tax=Cynoglossus semilaevis TaxID=244447 RepID=A0A3P8VC03_CYNSE|nr:RAD51-associated protein 1 [Cynoglossus semilaevis]